jgi:two-component system, LytTR family, response regulator
MTTPSGPLRVVTVDDEPLARDCIRLALAREPGWRIVAECRGGREAAEAIERESPDLVFLDVQMPGMDGFGVIERVGPERMPATIFVTAFEEHALRAFQVHALDYLLKPYTPARLSAAVQRAARQIRGAESPADRLAELLEHLERERRELGARAAAAPAHATRLLVKDGERMFFVPVERIDWLEAEGNYVRLHTGKEAHLVRGTLSGMEEQLDARRFTRIHRSTIVNVDRVKEVRPWFAGDYLVKLHDGAELRLSRRYRDRLL